MPTLALSMIVRDAEKDLPACLESARGLVDEIVVADTGSTDATPEVARRYGARVISIPWEQDYARARNLALAEVRSDWVLMLDADEQLDPGAARVLPRLMEKKDIAGYQITIRNYMSDSSVRLFDSLPKKNDSRLEAAGKYPVYVEHENVRLFRHHPEIYFVGRVHETVGPRIEATGKILARVPSSALVIHHFGLIDAETRARKNQHYFEMGQQKLREMPKDAQTHFEMGIIYLDHLHKTAEALTYFERACELNPKFKIPWFFAGVAHLRLGHHAQALARMEQAESRGYSSPALSEMQGDAHYSLGTFEAARRCYRRAHQQSPDSAELESKQGLAEVRAGHANAGLKRLQRAVKQEPGSADMHDRLVVANVWLGRLPQAAAAAERKLAAIPNLQPDWFLRAASIRGQLRDWERAAEILRQGLDQFPQAEKLRLTLAKLEGQKAQPPSRQPQPQVPTP